MSIQFPLRKVNVVSGDPSEPLKQGNVIEIVDVPVYQVDPVTRKTTQTLQQFVITSEGDHWLITPKK